MERIPIILNPAARSSRAARRLDSIQALRPAPEIHLTTGTGDAERLAESLARDGHPMVVAAGGDGTVNEVLQGLCRANAALPPGARRAMLGVLPMGTMNVFSLELGLPAKDLAACWARITSGVTREIDLWRANDFFFIQLAGVGVDAEIIRQTTWQSKLKFGPLSYLLSAFKVLRRKSPVLSLQVPGESPRHGSLILVGNGRHYGGPIRFFEHADARDGLLDVLLFHQVGPWELAQLAHRLATRGVSTGEDIEYLQLREFTVTSSIEAPMEVDGELRGVTPVHFAPADHRLVVAA